METPIKKAVWANIIRLIQPYRKKFLWVVTLGLLSTGVGLIEPLIYREAINDVAGLFVRQARENAQKDLGVDPEEAEGIRSMIGSETPDPTTTTPSVPRAIADSAALLNQSNTTAPAAHSRGHVAARSPEQAPPSPNRSISPKRSLVS